MICSDLRHEKMIRGNVFFEAFLSKKTFGDFVGNVSTSTNSTYSCSFTFTGKEKDSESGYHYFGARYYDSEALSGWLSVDPMSDKYPSMSPYNYCAWNPVRLVDPHGDTIRIQNENGQYQNIELSQISNFRNSRDPREQALYLMSKDKDANDILTGLSASSTCYDIQTQSKMMGGRVDEDRIVVWGKPADNYGGTCENIILEELYHCAQYAGVNNMSWTGDVETCEIPAKEFSARIYPCFQRYFRTNNMWVSTEMNIMAGGYPGVDSFSAQDKLNFLTQPMRLPTYDRYPIQGDVQRSKNVYYSQPAY